VAPTKKREVLPNQKGELPIRVPYTRVTVQAVMGSHKPREERVRGVDPRKVRDMLTNDS